MVNFDVFSVKIYIICLLCLDLISQSKLFFNLIYISEPPEIDLDASMRKLVTVRAGCPIRLFAIVRGRPAPKVTWRRTGIDNVIRKGQVDLVDTMAFLVIPNTTRDDSGKYSLTLVNAAGEKAVFVNVRVLGE